MPCLIFDAINSDGLYLLQLLKPTTTIIIILTKGDFVERKTIPSQTEFVPMLVVCFEKTILSLYIT